MGDLSFVLLLISAALSSIVGLTVLFRDYKKIENIAFFLLSIAIASWSIGIAGFTATSSLDEAVSWVKFYYFAPLLIVYSSVIFAQYFLAKNKMSLAVNTLIAVMGITLSLFLLLERNFITQEIVQRDYGKQVILDTTGYLIYGAYLLLCFGLTIAIIYKKTKVLKSALARQQAKVFLTGFVVSCFLGVTFNLILPGLGNYQYIVIGPVSTTVLAFAIAYAIVKHKMFDVRLVIARSMAYLGSIAVVASTFGFVVFGLLSLIFDQDISVTLQIVSSLATALVALGFNSIKKFFDKFSNKIFYRDAYDSQDFLDHLNRILVSSTDADALLSRSGQLIEEKIK